MLTWPPKLSVEACYDPCFLRTGQNLCAQWRVNREIAPSSRISLYIHTASITANWHGDLCCDSCWHFFGRQSLASMHCDGYTHLARSGEPDKHAIFTFCNASVRSKRLHSIRLALRPADAEQSERPQAESVSTHAHRTPLPFARYQ